MIPPIYLQNILDATDEHVVVSVSLDDIWLEEVVWLDRAVAGELRAAPNERNELIVVQAPDAVAAGGLHAISGLQPAHVQQVRVEDLQSGVQVVLLIQGAELVQRTQEHDERQLVPGSVVDSRRIAERFDEVGVQLDERRMKLLGQRRSE